MQARRRLDDIPGGVVITGGGTTPVVMKPTYLTFSWAHTEILPLSLLRGFRLVLFTGTDPNDSSKYLIEPAMYGPNDTGCVISVTVDASVTINAAIQSVYRNGNESSWRTIGGTVVVDPDTITIATKAQLDTVQGVADAAASNVAAALTAANNAQTAANAANAALADIASDSLLTPGEKPAVIQNRDVIVAEQAGIDGQATGYGITTEKTAYDTAVTALTTYLATLTTPVLWSNLTGNTTIVGTTFRSKFADVYTTRQALWNAIIGKAKTLADSAAMLASQSIKPIAAYNFLGASVPPGTSTALTVASSDDGTTSTFTANVANQFVLFSGLSLDPLKSYLVSMKIKWVSGAWEGHLYYSNPGHTRSASYYKNIPAPVLGEWTIITLDLRTLDVGGTDYMTGGNITNIWLDPVPNIGDSFALDWVCFGEYGVVSQADIDAAAAAAAAANASLADIASDSLLTPGEKPRVIQDRDQIVAEQTGLDGQATSYTCTAVDAAKTTYDNAVTALTTYLATLTTPVLWSNLTGNTTIVGATFRTKFGDVYTARQALMNAIMARAKTLADQANASLADIASDTLLTPDEKPRIIFDRDVILAEQPGIDTQATAYSITTEKTAYDTAVSALTTYLATLTAPVLWSNLGGNTTIVPATFSSKFYDVYNTKQLLLNAISAKAKTLADAAKTAADTANAAIADIASDSLLTPDEKPRIIMDRDVIVAEQSGLDTQATAFSITTEKTTYDTAVSALTTYLATLTSPVLWSTLSGNTTIVGATFRTKFSDVYAARQALINAISTKAKALADAAQTTANSAAAAAATAQTAANNAQTAANTANAAITDIASDSLLTPDEKPDIVMNRDVIIAEQTGIDGQATTYGITTEKTAYDNAVSALTTYLATLTAPVAWNVLSGNTTIVGTTFRTKFSDVYTTRQTLLNAIYTKAKALADAAQTSANSAQTTANAAQTAAATAQTAANNAQTAANTANSTLADFSSDALLTPDEKPRVVMDRDAIIAEQSGIDAQATAFGITTEKTTYDTAVSALTTYLATLTAPVLWSNLTGNTTIVGTTFRTKFGDVYAARQALLNAVYAKAKTLADAAQARANAAMLNGHNLSPQWDQWYLASQTIQTVSDAKVGTKVLRLTGGAGYPNDGIYHPIDPTRQYKVKFWARSIGVTDGGLLYFCLRQFQDNVGTPCPANGGRSPYSPPAQGAHADSSWVLYEHVWKGTDFQATCKYVQPDFLDCYSNKLGYWEIDGFEFYDMTESNTILNKLLLMDDDGVLSKIEKPQAIINYQEAIADHLSLRTKAMASGIATTALVLFDTAFNELDEFISSIGGFSDVQVDSNIPNIYTYPAASQWTVLWSNWYAACTEMFIKIASAAPNTVAGIATGNWSLTTNSVAPTIDGYARAGGDKVMLMGQTTKSENGIYQIVYSAPQGTAANYWPTTATGTITDAANSWDNTTGTPNNTTFAHQAGPTVASRSVIWSGWSGTWGSCTLTAVVQGYTDIGEYGKADNTLYYSLDGGATWITWAASISNAKTTYTRALTGVTPSLLQIKVVTRHVNAKYYDLGEMMYESLTSHCDIYSLYALVGTSGTANYAFNKIGSVLDGSTWRVTTGSTYGGGKTWLMAVAADNTITFNGGAQTPAYEAPLPLPSSNGQVLTRNTDGSYVYIAPSSGSGEPALGNPTVTGYLLSSTLAGVRSWVAPYSHPASHAATMITEDTTHRFITDAERTSWTGKVTFPGFGTAAGVACEGNDARLSNSRPASDVYAWAKAASKPTYTYSEVGACATGDSRLSDARPASDVYAWAKAASKPTYTYSEVGACATGDSRLSDARPASDVSAWAKAASKPTYTKSEVGLGSVDNTADSAKSVAYAANAGGLNTTYVKAVTRGSGGAIRMKDITGNGKMYELFFDGGVLKGVEYTGTW